MRDSGFSLTSTLSPFLLKSLHFGSVNGHLGRYGAVMMFPGSVISESMVSVNQTHRCWARVSMLQMFSNIQHAPISCIGYLPFLPFREFPSVQDIRCPRTYRYDDGLGIRDARVLFCLLSSYCRPWDVAGKWLRLRNNLVRLLSWFISLKNSGLLSMSTRDRCTLCFARTRPFYSPYPVREYMHGNKPSTRLALRPNANDDSKIS